jgi:hypothetical protein
MSITRSLAGAALLAAVAYACRDATEPLPPGSHTGYYVTTNGSATGTGSTDSPWNLATALDGGPGGDRLRPGDTVWIRQGTYTGNFSTRLDGSPGNDIAFRAYPGERATINGQLKASDAGSYLVFWGLEVMQSNPKHASQGGFPTVIVEAVETKLINLVVHDAGTQGISSYVPATNNEIYGSIVYNNGNEENLDHGIYVHEMNKRVEDCILFNNLANGIHGYETNPQANLYFRGNASFNNGSISTQADPNANNLLIRGVGGSQGSQALDNMLYFTRSDDGDNMRIGDNDDPAHNEDVIVRGNYIAGGRVPLLIEAWDQLTVQDNVVLGATSPVIVRLENTGAISTAWDRNTWHRSAADVVWEFQGTATGFTAWKTASGIGATDQTAAAPTVPKVFVRPNRYEPGRANIIIYNWTRQATVPVDVSGVLQSGDHYELRNAQNFFGAPVASGTYSGGTISVSMAGVNPPAPIGRTLGTPPRTAPDFDSFVLLKVP